MDVNAYLRRIHYTGSLEPTAATLSGLHLAHLLRVPFENLDISLGRPIRLESEALFDKLIRRRRGGFCYELNGLFALLLQALGFEVTYLSASDTHPDGSFGLPFDHLTLLVRGNDGPDIPWLADVGWGDTFRLPLRLDLNGEQLQDGRAYWLERVGEGLMLWQREVDGSVERQYYFTLQPYRFDEFFPMCSYHQTSPESSFTQRRICTLATPEGRITLGEGKLVTTVHGQRQEQVVSSEAERGEILRERFGIDLELE